MVCVGATTPNFKVGAVKTLVIKGTGYGKRLIVNFDVFGFRRVKLNRAPVNPFRNSDVV